MGPSLITSVFIQFLCIYNIVKSQDYDYLGCYQDTGARMLGHELIFTSLTPEVCIDYCQRLGYTYAGLQLRTYCYCGVQAPANLKINESDCDMECAGNNSLICGGSLRNSVYKINNPKKEYDYLGCFKDNAHGQALLGFINYLNNMSPNECIELCKGFGYLYAGLSFGVRCFCVNKLDVSNERPAHECSSPCLGDSQRMCGAGLRNSIYFTGIYSGPTTPYGGKSCAQPSAPVNAVKSCNSETCTITCLDGYAFPDGSTNVSISCISGSWKPNRSGWSSVPDCKVKIQEYLGCYTDDGRRTFYYNTYSVYMTTDMCIDYCQKLGYSYAGLRLRASCYCGFAPGIMKLDDEYCDMDCAGNKDEKCGSDTRNSVYKITNPKKNFTYLGCYKDQNKPRSLLGYYRIFNDMTDFQCINFCKTLGYPYAGLQGGGMCYCGNKLQQDTPKLDDSECNIRCFGEYNRWCGGVNKNSIYFTGACTTPCQNGGTCASNNTCECPKNTYGSTCQYCTSSPPTPANSTKTCDSKKCTITCLDNYTFSDGSSKVELLCKDGNWETAVSDCKENLKQYMGCYEEPVGSKMFGHAKVFSNLTVDICTDYCRSLGYSYFGLQYRSECFCGDYLPDTKMMVNDSKCDFACSGDNTQKCGSSGRNSLYKILKPLKAFTYVGCYGDILKDSYKYFGRLLPFQCTEYCKGQGSTYAGLQARFRCLCGTLTLPSDKKVAETQCNTRCAGDIYKICGGNSTDSVYATGL